jgi:2-dehydro-3-deoxygluconokinase
MAEVVTLGETMVMFSPDQNGPLRYAQRFQKRIAGTESNVAIGLVRLGHSAAWISRVGNDEFGEFLMREVRGEGVDVSGVSRDPEAQTGLMFKEVQPGRETRVTYYRQASAASRLSPADLREEYFRNARLLHLTGITPALSDSCLNTVEAAVRLARKYGLTISFDPNIRLKLWTKERAKTVLTRLVSQVDIVFPGLDEARLMMGAGDPEALLEKFRDYGVKIVALKAGVQGTWVASARHTCLIPIFQVEQVVDPIGAGDAFAAGFLSGFLEDKPLEECGRLANAMGALAVTTTGDFEGLPTRRALEAFIFNQNQIFR